MGWPGPGEKLTERQNSEGKGVSLHEKAGVTERKPGHTMTVLHWKSSVNGLNNPEEGALVNLRLQYLISL